jgi:cilia- and flagella-associated protein 57
MALHCIVLYCIVLHYILLYCTVLYCRQEEKVQREEEVRIDVMAQHTLLRSDMQALQKKANDQEGDIKKLRDKEIKMTDHMKSVEKEINGFKKEILKRDEAISEKELRISSLKKKNQELEKLKYVLDFNTKELKLQIAPREEEIEIKRKQIEDMNVELEQYSKSHTSLLLMINGLKLKLEGLRRELLDLKDRSSMLTRTQETIKRELEKLWMLIDQPTKLKESFLRIYHIYVQEDPRTKSGIKRVGLSSEDPQLAYNRDREMLEKSLENLRKTSKTEAASNKRESTKMNRERCSLISELNSLRREAGELRMQQQTIETAGQITPKMDSEVLTETLTLLGVNLSRRNSSALPKVRKYALYCTC